MGVRLPSAYQEVEYLESTVAGQYIDTLESVTNDIVVRAKFRFLTSYWKNYQSAFGAKGTSFDLQRGGTSATAFSVATFGTSVRVNVNYNIFQADTIAERSINSVMINGVTTALSVGQGTPSGTIWLFGKESANNSAIDVAAGTRIYSAEILSGNIVLKHFIPCYRKSDDEPGMYDLVSGTFYTNAGSGEFVVGPDVIDSISPWLVARRRMLFVSKLKPSSDYITIVNSFSNAGVARTEIDSIFTARGIDRTNKILVFKSAAQIANNQFLGKSWINLATDTGSFARYRNLNVNSQAWGSGSADCVGAVGDTYYVIDPTLQNQAQDFSVTVQSAITKADDLLSLIQASMPSTGVYAVYRNFNPSELAQYDYLWSLHSGTSSQYGFRADKNLRESNITIWNNVYDTHVNAGDKLYFLKLFDT